MMSLRYRHWRGTTAERRRRRWTSEERARVNSHSIVILLENAPYTPIEARVSTKDDLGDAGTIDVDGCTSLLMRPTSHTQAVHQSWHGSTGADGHHPLLHLPVSTHVLGGLHPLLPPTPPARMGHKTHDAKVCTRRARTAGKVGSPPHGHRPPDRGVRVGRTGYLWHDVELAGRVPAAHHPRRRLGALPADAARQLDVLGHNRHALGVDGAQVAVLKEADQVRL